MGRIHLARQEAPGTSAGAEGIVSRPDRERFARGVDLPGRVRGRGRPRRWTTARRRCA
ncbi:hypothetical protein ACFXKX_09000 [Streptomyces scopuliridis]|uniref:hypothetical protein n=1 Tax=Streptomyces scopuliridis TaxID=452529 RepID=UPI0036CA1DC6